MQGILRTIWDARTRLQFKATVVLTCVVLATAGASALLYMQLSSGLVTEQAQWRARDVARTLAVAASDPIVRADSAGLLAMAEQLIPRGGLQYVAFADPTGGVLAAAQQGAGQLTRLLDPKGRTVPVSPLDQPVIVNAGSSDARLDITYPVFHPRDAESGTTNQPIVGYVRLGLSLLPGEQRLALVMRQVKGIAFLIALLMVPMGYVLVNRLVRPLAALGDAARAFAAGQWERRVEVKPGDEIGDLAAAFNSMAGDLSRSHDDLVRVNAELEDRVQARTFQLTELNRRLQDEVAEKEEFLRAVSHDLAAPLRNVSGMISLARDRGDAPLNADLDGLLTRIDRSVRYELELIDELLELSRIRTRREEIMQIDLDSEVRGVAARLEYDIRAKNIALQIAQPLPSLWAERLRMRQLWQNLIDNAIKYTDPARATPHGGPPSVRITWSLLPDDYEFRVADDGIGVAPRDRDRIFYIFRRAKDSFVARTAGKGVGLASCRSIVQNYGGRIWVESGAQGGSVFCFTLARRRVALPPSDGRDTDRQEGPPQESAATADRELETAGAS